MSNLKKQTGARHLPIGIVLFLLLVAMPIAEVATFIEVGGRIGLWLTILCVIFTAALGTLIIRLQGIGLIQRVQAQFNAGALPAFEIFSGVCLLVAGALLLTPGFITDGIGFLLLWPTARRMAFGYASKHVNVANAKFQSGGTARGPDARGPNPEPPADTIIDVDYVEIEEPADMPPPGRGWDRKR